MTSAVGILDTLQHMLAQELALKAALEENQTKRDGLFNEIKEGRLTLPTSLPSEEDLEAMRTTWSVEVKTRLKYIFDRSAACEMTDRLLHQELTKMTPLIERVIDAKELSRINFCDPALAQTIISTDQLAKALLKNIQELHATNGVLRRDLVGAIERISSLDLDKWEYGLVHCRGVLPTTIQWITAPVRVGTFVGSITPSDQTSLPLTEDTQAKARTFIDSLRGSLEASSGIPFSERIKTLQEAFKARLVTTKERGLADATDSLANRINTITSFLTSAKSTLEEGLVPPLCLQKFFREKILTIGKILQDPAFTKGVEDLRQIQTLYRETLPVVFDTTDFSEHTLRHLDFLDPLLREKTQEIYDEVRKNLPSLWSTQAWLERIDLGSLNSIPDQLAAFSAKLSA